MGNWGDEKDPEVQALKEYKARFTLNFKKIYMDVDTLVETNMEITKKHPKDSLISLWLGSMTGMTILFLLSYQVFAFVTVLFMAFYMVGIFRIGKAWKAFRYKTSGYVFMTIGGIVLSAAIGLSLQWLLVTLLL